MMTHDDIYTSIEANVRKLKIRELFQYPPLLTFDVKKLPKNIRYGINMFNRYGCLTGSTVLKGMGLIDRDPQDIDIIVEPKMFEHLQEKYGTKFYTRRYNKTFDGYVGTIHYQIGMIEIIKKFGFKDFFSCFLFGGYNFSVDILVLENNKSYTVNSIDSYMNCIEAKIKQADNKIRFKNRFDIEKINENLTKILK